MIARYNKLGTATAATLINELEPMLMLLLGWAFGLLSPQIAERIRRGYRKRDLIIAVIDELEALQFCMAVVAWDIRSHYADVPDQFLDTILPVVKGYNGPERNEPMTEAILKFRSLPESARNDLYRTMKQANVGLSLKQYALPLFSTQLTDLAICPLAFQRAVLNVRYHLDLFNQGVVHAQAQFEKTFAGLSSQDHSALLTNIAGTYQELARRAEIIVDSVNKAQQDGKIDKTWRALIRSWWQS